MQRSFKARLEALEQLEAAQRGVERSYVVLEHEDDPLPDDLPPGWSGKVYIGISPDDWDADEPLI